MGEVVGVMDQGRLLGREGSLGRWVNGTTTTNLVTQAKTIGIVGQVGQSVATVTVCGGQTQCGW